MPSKRKPLEVVHPGPGRAPTATVSASALTFPHEGPPETTAEALGTTGADVVVGTAAPPLAGQVLAATSETSARWMSLSDTAPPSGAAGGDLAGSYPNPTVMRTTALKSAGLDVNVASAAAPSAGMALIATSSTAANWQPPSGDLAGSYPNPTVTRTRSLKSATTDVIVASAAAPSVGMVLTATSNASANWQAPANTLPPSGPASGDLGGTYPNPTVVRTRSLMTDTTDVAIAGATAPSANQILIASSPTAASWRSFLADSDPVDIAKDQNVPGTSNLASRADHRHDIDTGDPVALLIGGDNVHGDSKKVSRSNHRHQLPPYANSQNTAGTICEGNDTRLSDQREPKKHGSTHLPNSPVDSMFNGAWSPYDMPRWSDFGFFPLFNRTKRLTYEENFDSGWHNVEQFRIAVPRSGHYLFEATIFYDSPNDAGIGTRFTFTQSSSDVGYFVDIMTSPTSHAPVTVQEGLDAYPSMSTSATRGSILKIEMYGSGFIGQPGFLDIQCACQAAGGIRVWLKKGSTFHVESCE